MKPSLLMIIPALLLLSCGTGSVKTTQPEFDKPICIGQKITEDSAIDCSNLKDLIGDSEEVDAKVKGEIIGICPDKTCLLKVDLGDGTCMNVKMNNMDVPIPKDVNGKTAIMEGTAYVDTSNIKMMPGSTDDTMRSIAETEATKDPEVTLAFNARGLIIK